MSQGAVGEGAHGDFAVVAYLFQPREQGFPLVVLLNNGFPEEGSPHERYYKPGGVYFEACSRGKLLLLEPTEEAFSAPLIRQFVEGTLRRKAVAKHFKYTPIATDSLRYRFVALNEMGRLLVEGQGADGIRL